MIEIASKEAFSELYPHADSGYNYFRVDGVYFAASKRGEGINIHIAADREAKKKIRHAVNRFIAFLFEQFGWCKMVLATIAHDKKSVKNLAKKCGFEWLGDNDECSVFVRRKS